VALADWRAVVGQTSFDLIGPVAILSFYYQLALPALLVLSRTEDHFNLRTLSSVRLQLARLGTYAKFDAAV